MSGRLLKPTEAAERLAYSKATVYEFIRAGRLRAVRTGPGADWRIPEDALDEFVASLDSNQAAS
jgi:excisionase family DNA binding protein